ncbi:MAG: hypothetical protein ACRDG3_06475 [Tepidiformaceae bacterium]
MERHHRRHKPGVVQIVVTVVAIVALLGAYVAVMYSLRHLSTATTNRATDHRDLVYLFVHVGGLVVAAIGGFALGKWFSGLGVAFALLFVVVVSVGMLGAQMGSYTLACDAHHNDIVRHWTC